MPAATDAFIARWRQAGSAERSNAQSFLVELCDLIGVGRPPPANSGDGGPYRFERNVSHYDASDRVTTRWMDLYKRGFFFLEAKQGANAPAPAAAFALEPEATRRQMVRNSRGWSQHMLEAKGQAEGYIGDLPADEPAPPFIIACDVGFCFDVYADFSGTGRHYAQFPDRTGFRVYLDDLRTVATRQRLAAIWTDPHSLDPARRRAEVTREIAKLLARLARALEGRGHAPDAVASFLMRCLFCMFAQSVNLLPKPTTFTDLLESCRDAPKKFAGMVGEFWRQMNTGGFSAAAGDNLRRFNGGLYAAGGGGTDPLQVEAAEIALLIEAANLDWAHVEPAIFGTLLENALDERQRGQLGAHFTPRAFVERLVLPTVMEPLRREWDGYKAAHLTQLKSGHKDKAAGLLREFHRHLCAVRVLDPACGTGNFLYVTMELMKRLEGEVLDALANLVSGEGDRFEMPATSVGPGQFLGIERNPRAVPVAELVLWIGYLQWHFRTLGAQPPAEPILRNYGNIIQADALLTYEREEPVRDARGKPVTRWDGRTKRKHPVTGADTPDLSATIDVTRIVKPKMAVWPAAEFIVGNPPFIAGKDMLDELGEGYTTALRATYGDVPESADIALLFWWKAAQALATSSARTRRFGFITSNSIRQTFCRRVVAETMLGKRPLRLMFAIPDHPWTDGTGAAAVRIAFTVAEQASARDAGEALLRRVVSERDMPDGVPEINFVGVSGRINADLTVGADPDLALPLRANERISSPGVKLHGAGFIVTQGRARELGLGRIPGLEHHIRPYLNGRDLTQHGRGVMVIDLFGLSESHVRQRFPGVFQHVALHVKPIRSENPRSSYRDRWWLFGEPRTDLRSSLSGLSRYVATVETAKHRVLCFVDAAILPDNMLVCIATADAFHLGVLSSRIHVAWALAAGGTLEDRPRYNKTRCFDPFPFPAATGAQQDSIRALAEELDALRRTRLDAEPRLTMTALYNVLERLRAGTKLTLAERGIHDAGHVSVLRELHDQLDAAVAAAYSWPADLAAPAIVARVVALNVARRAEEQAGLVRWLRPDYQAPTEQRRAIQDAMPIEQAVEIVKPIWPKHDYAQFVALRAMLTASPGTSVHLAARFQSGQGTKIGKMLDTLADLGQARRAPGGNYAR